MVDAFHKDKNVLVVATKLGTAANLVKKIKSIHKNLPAWLKISDIAIDNRNSFELTNGSQVKASSTSGDAGRSEALSLLVIDEAAFVEGIDELWAGLYPPYQLVVAVSPSPHRTVSATGSTKPTQRQKKTRTTSTQSGFRGMYTQNETSLV